VIGHNDAAPYNAVWQPGFAADTQARLNHPTGRLIGFIDWDFAAPCPAIWDLAFVVFSWVPLHARDIATADGFHRFGERPGRLRRLLTAYGYTSTVEELLDVVRARIQDHSRGVRQSAAAGDPFFARLIKDGVLDALDRALDQLEHDRTDLLHADG
jgi:thiamine kinase-like enzyme